MKSFKDYLEKRSAPLSEMAVDPIMRGDKEIRQHIKTPIQFDQDDINFLKQFPPQFWAQALNRRYSVLLLQTKNFHDKGERMPDDFYVQVIGKRGTKLSFPVKNAKMNELYEELDGVEDSTRYSRLTPEDLADDDSIKSKYYSNEDGSERTHIKQKSGKIKKLSKYGFDLEGLKLEDPKPGVPYYEGHAKGYVVPGRVVCREAVSQWISHLDQGWYDDQIEGPRGKVNFGGGEVGGKGRSKSEKKLPIVPGSEDHVWVAKKGSGEKSVKFTSAIPDIRPGFHIDANDKKIHDEYLKISKQLRGRISARNFKDYIELLSDDFLNNPQFEDVDIIDNKKVEALKSSASSKSGEELITIKKLLEFVAYLSDSKNKKSFVELYRELHSIADSENKQEVAIVNTIQKTLEKITDYIEEKRINVLKSIKKYNVHQWNSMMYNSSSRSPIKNLVQIGGVVDVHNQQVGVHFQKLRDIFEGDDEKVREFWNHLVNETEMEKYCKMGAEAQIYKQKETVSRVVSKGIESIYIRSLKEAMLENIDSISKNALEQFLNKSGLLAVGYAGYFKKKIVDEGMSIDSFLQNPTAKKHIKQVGESAKAESANYAFQVFQLQKRFLEGKYNRDQTRRPENPHEYDVAGLSLLQIIEKFHSGDPAIQDLAPGKTSHAISTLESAATARAFREKVSEIETVIKTDNLRQGKKDSVNNDSSEKAMNRGIFVSTIEKVRKALGSTMASAAAAAEKVTGAVGGALGRIKSIIGSKKIPTEQPTEQQPQPPTQETQPKTKPSVIDRLKSILGRS